MSTPTGVFVTGATGVIGQRVIPQLVAQGHRVTGVARSSAKRAQLEALGARAVTVNLLDGDSVRRALEQGGHEVVVNLATHIPGSSFAMLLPWSWRENNRLRSEGSAVLVGAARAAGAARFIQESFAPVYEDGGAAWIDESWPVRPAPYNRTVLDAERSAARFTERGGTGVVLRFAGFYGPDPMLRDLLGVVRRGWAPLPGTPDAYWSSAAHDDAATAVVAALDVPAGIYNVCDDEPVTRREYAALLAVAAGAARAPRPMPGWVRMLGGRTMELLSRSQRMSNRKLRDAAGWAPRWPSVREGIPAAVSQLAAR
ncbi:MAG TPA: NAD(P)-dependent oxidoreductase [Gemmatimonadaceae bacterium]|nr:NAD(P)-dependent oxidoreductase [Gemmatimonadaceae bacterium]